MRLHSFAWPLAALAALAISSSFSCSGSAGSPDASGGASGDFEITVSASNPPTFGWPGAEALGLSVTEYPNTATRLWTLGVPGMQGFGSGVTYGVVPAGALQLEPGSGAPAALVEGREYVVGVTRADGKGASRTFTVQGTASGSGDAGAAPGDSGTPAAQDGGTTSADGGAVSSPDAGTSDAGSALPPGLKLWLAADQGIQADGTGKVYTWTDSSGNGAVAFPGGSSGTSYPLLVDAALNGKPVVRFDGKDDNLLIESLDAFRGDYSVVLVGYGAGYSQDLFAATFPTDHGVLVETSLPGKIRFLHRSPPGTQGGSDLDQGTTFSSSASQILVFTKSAVLESFVNGQSTGPSTAAAGNFSEAAKVALGRQGYSLVGRHLKGDLAEVRVYDRALPTAERQALEQELSLKYGIALP